MPASTGFLKFQYKMFKEIILINNYYLKKFFLFLNAIKNLSEKCKFYSKLEKQISMGIPASIINSKMEIKEISRGISVIVAEGFYLWTKFATFS